MSNDSEGFVTVTLSRRDAEFAVEHLRFLVDREVAKEAEHAKANLSTRFVADEIEAALKRSDDNGDERTGNPRPSSPRARWLRPYLPNTSTQFALVSLDRPGAAHWPIRLTQIVGGKTWSISFARFLTPTPRATTHEATR